MRLSELMQGKTPDTAYEGWVTADDWVLAINTTPGTDTAVENYAVVQMGIEGLDAQLNPVTSEKTYIRAGKSTLKTGTARSFAVSGDRYVGDEAQDYMLSHAVKYGRGNGVITDYVYFCILNGHGEKGQVSIIVNTESGGNAEESSTVDIQLSKVGKEPEEYTYSVTQAAAQNSEQEA